MSLQDKMEKTLRQLHVTLAKSEIYEKAPEYVIVNKKEMIHMLNELNGVVYEMMDAYELTQQSRDKAEREVRKKGIAIIKNANQQAEDIYAASVLYTDDALNRIQDIIDEATESMQKVFGHLNRDLKEKKRVVKTNQLELKSQLQDLEDTKKYLNIIEDRNREIAKLKEDQKRKEEGGKKDNIIKKEETAFAEEIHFTPVQPEIKINEEYFKQAGLTPEGLPIPLKEQVPAAVPEIKVHTDSAYFKKAGQAYVEDLSLEEEEAPEEKEKRGGRKFPFVKRL